MSWSELERLVEEAECDAIVRRGLRRCRSRRELILAARRFGYRINLGDLQQAWQLRGGSFQPGPACSSIVEAR